MLSCARQWEGILKRIFYCVGILFKTYCRHIHTYKYTYIYNVVVTKYLLVVFAVELKGNHNNIVDVKCLTVTDIDAFIEQSYTTTKTL